MRFLLDQDVFELTARFLASLGHDALRVADAGLNRAPDESLLEEAHALARILLTRDRDFGALVFHRSLGPGVIYLRSLPSTLDAAHRELEQVLTLYSEEDLRHAFVVIRPGGHRFRHLPRE